MSKKKRKSKRKNQKIITICLLIVILCLGGIIYYYVFSDNEVDIPIIKEPKKEKKQLKIVDENSNQRPIAVMYDNNVGYNSHAGLQDAYLSYEIIVEGGLTRIMALFKDKDVSLIGPVRSSRHYFLDYALESDAIYCHFGWSEFAKNDITALGVNNINGLTNESAYWRDKNIRAPHNVFTSTETLYKKAKESAYKTEVSDWKLLNYSVDEINLSNDENTNSIIANNVNLKYSNYQTTSYSYDSENNYYLRSMDGNHHIDKNTKEQLHYKNIIVEKVSNRNLDSYGRQDLDTVGSNNGYYITNGYAIPITWNKSSRSSKTKYTDINGKEIKVNDGNTFIQIIPVTTQIEIS